MNASADVIYVVHGSNAHTWWRRLANRGYPWWRRWSLFCIAVRDGYSRDCEVREFRWSGRNSHQSRMEAGAALAEAIEKEDASRTIHLIGHSHGGNVILVALSRLSRRKVDNVVLLANPHMALIDSRGATPEWLYWGNAGRSAQRIWNVYSPQDLVQGRLAEWFHGVPRLQRKVVHVRREYGGPEHKSIRNIRIHWRRRPPAHRSMHSEKIGFFTGALLGGASADDAARSAGLSLESENDIPDRGGWPGVERTFERIQKLANPAPFQFGDPASSIAVLFVHGFTASPAEMRPLAQFVAQSTGWRCEGIVLPGHGTRINDMDQTRGTEWIATVNAAYESLAKECEHVFLVGLSLGAVLTCHVAAQQLSDDRLRGLVLIAPAFAVSRLRAAGIQILRRVNYVGKKTQRAADYFLDNRLYTYLHLPMRLAAELLRLGSSAIRNMPKLQRLPLMMVVGDRESTVSLETMLSVARDNPGIRLLRLPHSRHILTVEPDKHILFKASVEFMEECLKGMGRI